MLLVCHMPSFVAGLTAATGTGDVSRKTGFEAGDLSSQAVRIVCLRKIGGVLTSGVLGAEGRKVFECVAFARRGGKPGSDVTLLPFSAKEKACELCWEPVIFALQLLRPSRKKGCGHYHVVAGKKRDAPLKRLGRKEAFLPTEQQGRCINAPPLLWLESRRN